MKNLRYLKVLTIVFALMVSACGEKDKKEKTDPVTPAATVKKAAPEIEETAYPEGKKLYGQYCATCHQRNGSGVPNLNPPLRNTDYVTGNTSRLIRIILKGSDEGLEVDGQTYANTMPAHDFLDDTQVAELLAYIRTAFGNTAGPVTAEEVRTVRHEILK
ncbi:Cytochrome c, mono-and diheme variants [Sinomicrobium oceani]|uniref:Cytochrome c, mono-and diheme variants n=1 Tax=Sinomicrobium oceani TaxID=1150368 RepID=A0A1K1QCX4_9FLAO|nr:c-type cytochrome [Sinomicrobium oceani]SFW57553.1 Cytochrome c, mono-and diheme variants [Sinomicrobium oceani]